MTQGPTTYQPSFQKGFFAEAPIADPRLADGIALPDYIATYAEGDRGKMPPE